MEFLSTERGDWDPFADLTLARCIVELQALVQAQDVSGLEVSNGFSLLMQSLESRRYVSASGGAVGVPVYEWRVAAGICPKRHFILHASQDALSVPSRGFDYLGEALREELRPGLRSRSRRGARLHPRLRPLRRLGHLHVP